MAKSKTNPKRKQKQLNYKNSHKRKTMENNQQQLPEVRNVPVWKSTDKFEMNGLEFQEIFNFLNNINGAYMATQSIMNKNIMNGTVKMQFEKINPETGQYEPLSGDDAKPYEDDFNAMVETVRKQNENPQPSAQPQEEPSIERLDAIVDANGVPYNEEDRGKPNLTIV